MAEADPKAAAPTVDARDLRDNYQYEARIKPQYIIPRTIPAAAPATTTTSAEPGSEKHKREGCMLIA